MMVSTEAAAENVNELVAEAIDDFANALYSLRRAADVCEAQGSIPGALMLRICADHVDQYVGEALLKDAP